MPLKSQYLIYSSILVLGIFIAQIYADEHHHEEEKMGTGKAIIEVNERRGLRLSPEAIETLGIRFLSTAAKNNEFKIEKSTLVSSKNSKGVYRYRDGYFKFLAAEIKKEIDGGYWVKVPGVDFGDQVVSRGVGLLRVADVYSTDKSEYARSH